MKLTLVGFAAIVVVAVVIVIIVKSNRPDPNGSQVNPESN